LSGVNLRKTKVVLPGWLNKVNSVKNRGEMDYYYKPKLTPMKQTFLFAAAFAFVFFSCKKSSKVKDPVVAKKEKPSLVIGNPLDCGMENMLIFPVGTNYQPDVIEKPQSVTSVYVNGSATMCLTANTSNMIYDRSAATEYVNNNENEFDIRNILFYDQKNGSTYQLLSDTMHILSFAIHKEFSNPLILYRMVKKDINKDSIYNSKDAVMLFVSDIFGKHLTKITPDEEQFVEYYYYADSQTLLAKTIINANKDTVFTTADETNFREMKIKEPAMGREIFTKSLKDSLRLQGNTY
jgi:hypothetical protein